MLSIKNLEIAYTWFFILYIYVVSYAVQLLACFGTSEETMELENSSAKHYGHSE